MAAGPPLPDAVASIELKRPLASPNLVPRAVALNVGLVRYNGVTWAETQPLASVPPVWTSSQTLQAFSDLLTITSAGLEPIVILRDAPAWARVNPAHPCGAIQPTRYSNFASFVIGFLTEARRRAIPLRYIEIFNEPDALETTADHGLGCWGDPDDPEGRFGGDEYGDLLAAVYPAVKRAHPDVSIVLGGLLYHCGNEYEGGLFGCREDTAGEHGDGNTGPRFLRGVLTRHGQNDGGNYFDLAAFHAYPKWWLSTRDQDQDLYYDPSLVAGGGLWRSKFDAVRADLAEFGVHKPLLMNEGGLVCGYGDAPCAPRVRGPGPDEPGELSDRELYLEDQSRLVYPFLLRLWSRGASAATWYLLQWHNWRDIGLFQEDQVHLRPAYLAYFVLSRRLHGATYVGRAGDSVLEGYRFCSGQTETRVYWTNERVTTAPRPTDIPAHALWFSHLGNSMPTPATVGYLPVLVDIPLGRACSANFGPRRPLTNDLKIGNSYWSAETHLAHRGDFDGDGFEDVLLQQRLAGQYQTYLTRGTATGLGPRELVTSEFGLSASLWAAQDHQAVVGDFNGDGKDDVLLQPLRATGQAAYLLPGAAITGFGIVSSVTNSFGMTLERWAAERRTAVVGDWNGDGETDLLLQPVQAGSGDTYLLLGRAAGGFFGAQVATNSWGTTSNHWSGQARILVPGDFNGDGRDDLLLQQRTSVGLNTFLLTGDGPAVFRPVETVTTSWGTSAGHWAADLHQVLVGDFDGDGREDLILQQQQVGNQTWLLRARATGGFDPVRDVTQVSGLSADHWAVTNRRLHPGDFNGDGAADLLLQQRDARFSSFLLLGLPSGGGTFAPVQTVTTSYRTDGYTWAEPLRELLAGDWNGDGVDDLVLRSTRERISGTWQDSYVLLSRPANAG